MTISTPTTSTLSSHTLEETRARAVHALHRLSTAASGTHQDCTLQHLLNPLKVADDKVLFVVHIAYRLPASKANYTLTAVRQVIVIACGKVTKVRQCMSQTERVTRSSCSLISVRG